MVVNTSRILSLDSKVPRVLAANPDIVQLTPLSATQVQLLAKKAGVTQVNLWDEKEQIHTVDVIVYGDTRELSMLLQSQFPTTVAEGRAHRQQRDHLRTRRRPEPDQPHRGDRQGISIPT